MAQMERKSVGFSQAEVRVIETLLANGETDLLDEALLGPLASPLQALGVSASPAVSFSDAVRKLALIGLAQVSRAQRAQTYRRTADDADEAFDRGWMSSASTSAAAALDAVQSAMRAAPASA